MEMLGQFRWYMSLEHHLDLTLLIKGEVIVGQTDCHDFQYSNIPFVVPVCVCDPHVL